MNNLENNIKEFKPVIHDSRVEFSNNLENIIKEFKPLISASTLHTYLQTLKKLFSNLETYDFKALDNIENIKSKISYLSPLSQRNVYNAIIVLLQATDNTNPVISEYTIIRDGHNNDYSSFQLKHEKTEKEALNWVSKKELDDTLEYWKAFCLQRYLVLRMLMAMPLRNEFKSLQMTTWAKYKKLDADQKHQSNFFIKEQNPTRYRLGLNCYKTAGTYGERVLDIPTELNADIGRYLRKTKNTSYLFTRKTGGPFSSVEFTKYVKSIFARTGKKVGTTMLRHVMASLSGADALEKQTALAETMCHSLNTNTAYIKL
jgi:integrase